MEYNTDDILKNMEEAMYDLILDRITTDEDVEDCYLVNDVGNGKLRIMYMEQAFENGKLRGKSLIDLMRNPEGIAKRPSCGRRIQKPFTAMPRRSVRK